MQALMRQDFVYIAARLLGVNSAPLCKKKTAWYGGAIC